MYRPGEYDLLFPVLVVQVNASERVELPENGTVSLKFNIPKVRTYIQLIYLRYTSVYACIITFVCFNCTLSLSLSLSDLMIETSLYNLLYTYIVVIFKSVTYCKMGYFY